MMFSAVNVHLPFFLTRPDIWSATPIAALWTSVVLVLAVTMAIVFIALIFGRFIKAFGSAIIELLQGLDKLLVKYFSWLAGTIFPNQWIRVSMVLVIFFSIALAGTFTLWPCCMWFLAFGLLLVLIVFRDWSHNEDAVEYQLGPEEKDVKVEGNLHIELIVACAFVFVYTPIAFSQMHQHDKSFDIGSESDPYAFVAYMIAELVKVIPYHDFLPLPRVELDPSLEVRSAIFVFQTTLFAIIVTALKRFFDIARRVAYGLDLRPVKDSLAKDNVSDQVKAVSDLGQFAIRGRSEAIDLLINVTNQENDTQEVGDELVADDADATNNGKHFRYSREVRLEAADAIVHFGERIKGQASAEYKLQGRNALQAAIDAYKNMEPLDQSRWAEFREKTADAKLAYGKLETFLKRIDEARKTYEQILRHLEAQSAPFSSNQELSNRIARLRGKIDEARKILAQRRSSISGQGPIGQIGQAAVREGLARLSNEMAKEAIEGQANWLSSVLWRIAIGIILVIWILGLAFSLSGLPFLVGGWSWLISHLANPFSGIVTAFITVVICSCFAVLVVFGVQYIYRYFASASPPLSVASRFD